MPDAFNDLSEHACSPPTGAIITSQLNQQDRENVSGTLEFEISRDAVAAFDAALKKAGDIITRTHQPLGRTPKIRWTARFDYALESCRCSLPAPRQKTTLAVEVGDVPAGDARPAGGAPRPPAAAPPARPKAPWIAKAVPSRRVVVEVPLDKAASLMTRLPATAQVRVNETTTDEHAPDGRLARARIEVTFGNSSATVGGAGHAWDAVRHGLSVSGAGLRWSLTMIVIGFCFVVPWVLVGWVLWKLFFRPAKVQSAPVA